MIIENPIIDFDDEFRIFHLTASPKIYIRTKKELSRTCQAVRTQLEKYAANERCFIVVDLAAMIIEPALADYYSSKIQGLSEKYIYPGGLLRYGFQITRVTARMGYEKGKLTDLLMFANK